MHLNDSASDDIILVINTGIPNMISIVIPLYNKQNVIKYTIESVIRQTLTDWECIVVDDGSTDSSSLIVNSFNDRRIKYFYKSNGGVSSARNYGAVHAKGDWVVFLDADDVLVEDCLEAFSECGEIDGIDIVAGNFFVVKGDKRIVHNSFSHVGETSNPFREFFKKKLYMRPGSFMIRRSVAIQIPYNLRFSRYEDLEVQINYMLCCRIFVLNKPVMEYKTDTCELSISRNNFSGDYLSYLELPSKDFWSRMVIYRLMYVALRNYWNVPSVRKQYIKFLPMIIFSSIVNVIITIWNNLKYIINKL
jgi:glycosyltransferase involved in cell wall biosynthesis